MKRLLSVAQLAAAGVVLSRVMKGRNRRAALTGVAGTAGVTVVIPARNEAGRLGACLQSIPDGVPVIVVDDGSTDETAEIAIEQGIRLITAPPLPAGWVGKPWAMQQGLEAVETEFVVFIDADVRFTGDVLGALIKELQHHDCVSLSTTLIAPTPAAQALSASMVTTLVYRFGAVGVETSNSQRVIGNGQCFAAGVSILRDAGGFALARENMTDDIAMTRELHRKGLRVAFLDGSKLLETRMYDSAAETWQEWPRSLPMNDVTSVRWRVLDTFTLWLTLVLPVVRVVTRRAGLVDRLLLVQRWLLSAALLSSFRKPRFGVLFSPLTDVPVILRMTWTTFRPVRVWRGRQYGPQGTASR